MSWIELHQSAPNHPKILKLAHLLEVSSAAGFGHVCRLWLWAIDYAEDGNLSKHDPAVLAMAVGLPAECGATLWKSLHETKLVNANGHIHDWDEYAGRLVQLRVRNRRRAKQAYRQSARRLRAECVQSTGLPTDQPTRPTGPDQTNQTDHDAGGGGGTGEGMRPGGYRPRTPGLFFPETEGRVDGGTESHLRPLVLNLPQQGRPRGRREVVGDHRPGRRLGGSDGCRGCRAGPMAYRGQRRLPTAMEEPGNLVESKVLGGRSRPRLGFRR